jgi:acyl dehydratase
MSTVEWAVGAVLPPWTAPPVSRTDIVRYQGAAGDFDPAHHSDEHARRFGYPGVFSLGMLHAGMLGAYVTRFFDPASIRRFRTRFAAVAYPGDVLTYSATVAELRSDAGRRWLELDLLCRRDADGTAVTQGRASILLAG